jgi:O-acetylserine/cysteine efflux transporter
MTSSRRFALIALIASGVLWGASVPLSKVALGWLDPAWLTLGRFLIAGIVLAMIASRQLRAAFSWQVAVGGALGFGACVALQSTGIDRTSVSHASVLMGVAPVLVALTSLISGQGRATRREMLSFGLSLLGIALIAGGGGGGASLEGDGLVLVSVLLSAGLIAAQPRLLLGRDPAAVTAVQFAAAAGFVLPLALAGGHLPAAPASAAPVIAFAALTLTGTVLPFWLFAFGQAKVRPQLAGAFVNLEPVVGAGIGWVLFANPVGPGSIVGVAAVLSAIVLAATVRTPAVPQAAGRAWRHALGAHEALAAAPGELNGQLHWRRRGADWELNGVYLPGDGESELTAAALEEPLC